MPLSASYQILRRAPLPMLSIAIGLVVGLLVWLVLDQLQPKAVREIFVRELETRLDQQARESLIRFDQHIALYVSTTRLLAHHRSLASYLEPIYWLEENKGRPDTHFRPPPWLPTSARWGSLVQPGYILLIDQHEQVREIFQLSDRPLPDEFTRYRELYLSESEFQAYLTTLQERPYLLVSEPTEDVSGSPMGKLMLIAPIDDHFLAASQRGGGGNSTVVALLDADAQQFLASSDPGMLPVGTRMTEAAERYLVTSQAFFGHEGSDLNMQFATLIPRSVVTETSNRVLGLEREQRLITSLAFILVFVSLIFLLSARISTLLARMSRLSQQALGLHQPVIERGNQLLVLEEWIDQFIGLVRADRDARHLRHTSEIEESQRLKGAIMEAALDSIITVDESGRIVEFNPTAERTFNYQRDRVIGEAISELVIAPAARTLFQGLLERAHREPDLDSDQRSEMEGMRQGAERFPMEVAIKPIQLQERVLFTVYLHDISQRRRSEREIQQLAKFPAESPSPMARVNLQGVLLYANPASEELLQYWGCERGQTLPLFWRARIGETFEGGGNREIEVNCGRRIYSLLLVPLAELRYVNLYGRDITSERIAERRATEHQQELVHVCRLSTMGEMATGLAHELNQPLAAIANYASGSIRRLRSASGDPEAIVQALQQISTQADRAGEIIRRLRALVGKQPPVRREVDLNELVLEVCSFVEFLASRIGVRIEQTLTPDPLWARIDLVQVEQVLLNLVRNALDALREVPLERRSLRVITLNRGDGTYTIKVADSGPGIPDEARSRLFEAFYTTKESGMGIGLAISRTIMEDHRGRIEVESTPGHGASFSMVIPGSATATTDNRRGGG